MVPSQDYYIEERERRHSYITPPTTKPPVVTAAAPKFNEKPNPQRISFNLEPAAPSAHLSPPSSSQTATKSKLKPPKHSTEPPVRPSNFNQEMVMFKPLKQPDSRSASPSSNISCYGSEKAGSEKAGSERSLNTWRTASIASDKSAKAAFPVSPVSAAAAGNGLSKELPKPESPSLKNFGGSTTMEDSHTPDPRTQIFHGNAEMDISFSPRHFSGTRPFVGAGRKGGSGQKHLDTPGSTFSGPAALLSPGRADTGSEIHRSKSASALSGSEVTRPMSPQTTLFTRVPKPSSPLVARHKPRAGQDQDNRSS